MYYYYLGILLFTIVAKVEAMDFSSLNLIAITFAGGVIYQQFRDVKKRIGELAGKVDNLPCCVANCPKEVRDRNHNNHANHK